MSVKAEQPSAPPRVDISVVTHNSAAHLETLVQSLARQSIDMTQVRIFFIDNNSTDDTIEKLSILRWNHVGVFHSYNIIENSTNVGFGGAHNTLLEHGDAPFIFILNPDTQLYPSCLATLLQAAEADNAQTGVWEPRQIPYEHPKVYDPITMTPTWCCGAALLVRRTALAAVSGFDKRIFLYCEDVDLSWRLHRAGWHLRYVPSACVRHDTYDFAGHIKPAQFIQSVLGMLYLRTRFGTLGDMVRGYAIYFAVLLGRRHFRGQRKGLLIIGTRYVRDFLHFFTRRRTTEGVYFSGLDFAPTRLGAFHVVTPFEDIRDTPLVSILVRSTGRLAQVRRALRTIANQTYKNIEVVVVEDGPATLKHLLESFPKLRILYKPLGVNHGRCHAGNVAMEAANGKYFGFLDEDDELFADHVEQLVAHLEGSGAKLAYATSFEVKTEWNGHHEIVQEGRREVIFNRPFTYIELYQRNIMPICSVLFERSLFEDCGGFDLELENQEDWDLWLRFAKKSGRFERIEKTTSLYRVPLLEQDSTNRRKMLLEYYDKVKEKHKNIEITMNINDITQDFTCLLNDYVDILGVPPHSLMDLQNYTRRRQWIRWTLRVLQRTFRLVLPSPPR